MTLPWWFPFGRVPEIGPAALSALLGGAPGTRGPQLVDVRTQGEFASGHLPGAVNVPVIALPHRLASLSLDPRRPVVAICLTAHRSVPAVRLLRQRGYEAFQLAGGMLAWRAARLGEDRG